MTTKILMLNPYGIFGGDVEMYMMALPHLPADEFEVHVASIPRGPVYERLMGHAHVTVHPIEFGGMELAPNDPYPKRERAVHFLGAVMKVVRLIAKHKIDLIYVLDRSAAVQTALAASYMTRTPLMVNAQIAHYLETSQLHRRLIARATKLTVSSSYMNAKFRPYVSSADKLETIPNAIRVDEYDSDLDGSAIRREFNISDDVPVVVLAGRLSPFKGQDDMIRAAKLVLGEVPNCIFLLAGAHDPIGEEVNWQQHLEDLIVEQGVGENVIMMGHRLDLDLVFATADVVTMPSHEEAFGLVALEGLASGRPVVSTRAGGVPEFLEDGVMGFLIAPKDHVALAEKITYLLRNPDEAKDMGRAGRRAVEKSFDAALYSERIIDVLRSFPKR